MRVSRSVGLLLLVGGVALTSATLVTAARAVEEDNKTKAAVQEFKPVLAIHEMMEGQGKLFAEIREGILDKQWKEAARAAWLLAEIANVNRYQHDAADYKRHAKEMSGYCVELARLLKKEDEAGAKTAVRKVSQKCSACHEKYKD